MLSREFPQQVVLLGTGLRYPIPPKRKLTEGVQADSDAKCIRRQLALVAVLAGDGKLCVEAWRHVEATVAKRVERPVGPGIIRRNAFGHRENRRLQLEHVLDSEESIHKGKALRLGNDGVGD